MRRRLEYRWIVVIVVVFNSFMQYMDSTIVNVGLPTIGGFFRASSTTMGWTVTGYLLSLAMLIPLSGWMGDRIGTKGTFLLGLVTFALGSGLCATSWSAETLILFRVLQGAGAGLLTPVGTTMLYRVFPPEERAKVTALIAVPTVIAPALGPVVGGYLVQYVGWTWIFLVNLPFAILGILMAGIGLREDVQNREGRFDAVGFLTGSAGVGAVIYALQEVGLRGLGDDSVGLAAGAGAVLLALFVARELTTREPMVALRLFADRLFAAGTIAMFFVQALFVGGIFLLPFLLQSEKGLSPFHSGLVAFPVAIGVGMAVPLAARWYRRVGPRRLLLASMFLSMLSSLGFVLVSAGTSEWGIRLLLLPRGWAFGIALVALGAAAYARLAPEQLGRATSLFGTVGQLGAGAGVAFLATALASRMAAHHAAAGNPQTVAGAWEAFHETFAVSALLALLGMGAALLVSDRLAAASMRQGASSTK